VLSGGVFMNIKACKEISELNDVKDMLVVPSSSDESLPFGALYKINKLNNQNISVIKNLYLGMSYENSIDKFINKLDKKKFTIKEYNNFQDLNSEAANLIAKNNIVARCTGREEWGARALGNRSILCNPSKLENIKIINEAIKQRDYWMPFSPSILKNDAEKYFYNTKKIDAKFMTCLFNSTDLAKDHLKAAIHPIDFTMRPQLVDEQNNKEYYDLILKFKKISGIGGLLNTSFNLHGEPNVSNYDSAIHTVINSKLSYLIIENYLIEKIG
jgi:carbamoyltransferase